MKDGSVIQGCRAVSLGVKAEKLALKTEDCMRDIRCVLQDNIELLLEKQSVNKLLVGFNWLSFGAVVD
jgi:hypothetical protein